MLCVGEIITSSWNHCITDDVMWNSSVLWCMGNGDVMSNLISRSCSVKVEPLSISCVILGSYMYDVMVKYVWYVCIFESWCLLDELQSKQIQRYQLLHPSMYVPVYPILPLPSPSPYTYTYTYTQSIYTSLHAWSIGGIISGSSKKKLIVVDEKGEEEMEVEVGWGRRGGEEAGSERGRPNKRGGSLSETCMHELSMRPVACEAHMTWLFS